MGSLIAGVAAARWLRRRTPDVPRFRLTDPLLTGRTRRALASTLGQPDVGGGIPTARWVRAMTFERLVHDKAFVSELLTRAVGLLEMERPTAVRVRSGQDSLGGTATELGGAHLKARHAGEATMLFGLRVPFLDLGDDERATDVRPDFAIVAPRTEAGTAVGSWLVMGDAKDYERVRARIDDGRMLKGFLQVALGAESAAAWSKLPTGMSVHRYGVLAVPRNAYLRPEATVEDLADHRREVRARVQERVAAYHEAPPDADHRRRAAGPGHPRHGYLRPRHLPDLLALPLLPGPAPGLEQSRGCPRGDRGASGGAGSRARAGRRIRTGTASVDSAVAGRARRRNSDAGRSRSPDDIGSIPSVCPAASTSSWPSRTPRRSASTASPSSE